MENSRSDVPMPLQPLDPLHKYSLPYESIWNGALYSTFWMKINSQNVLVWLSKMVWHNIFAPDAETGKRHRESLTPAVDWLNALIGPGGLLLLLSDLLQSQFQFYGWGQNKEIHNNFIKEIASCWSVTHTEHGWSWCQNCTSSKYTMPASLVLPVEWWSGADLTLFQLFCLTFYMLSVVGI
jgi:hypothetical protein